jgi:hypothetical protein
MDEQKPRFATADDLAKSNDVQLSEEELSKAAGGAAGIYVKTTGIAGENSDVTKSLDKTSPI